jgi:hypothetical protein
LLIDQTDLINKKTQRWRELNSPNMDEEIALRKLFTGNLAELKDVGIL